jgi:hypothetical protein
MRKRSDSQKSGLAGEFFVAAELLKRDYQVSVTFGNAKSVDLFVLNERTNRTMIVQVKALRAKNYFAIEPYHIKPELIYVFVLLHQPDDPVEFFITDGATLLSELPKFFGPTYQTSKFNGIYYKALMPFKGAWGLFDQ